MEFGMKVTELAVRAWFGYFFLDETVPGNIVELTT